MTNKATSRKATIIQQKPEDAIASQLRGASKGIVDVVEGITNIVEQMHGTILGLTPIVGKAPTDRTGGIPGFVYSSVRGVTHVVGAGLDVALNQLSPFLKSTNEFPQHEAMLAALNGVFGDYLAATNNPLAIPMQLRQQGRALSSKNAPPPKGGLHRNGKLVVLVHGLCMNDLQWNHELRDHSASHDHGVALARDLGYTAIYLHYNSGRHIATNGEEFAIVLENLVQQWPVPITELTIIGHSMGGLVARSACVHAKDAKHIWLKRLKKIIFLGTPHHGAPLERAGNWLDILLDVSPYSAPFSKLGKVRSAGIKDLRYGHILDAETMTATPSPTLPKGVKCFAIAATKQTKIGAGKRLPGDGLVPVNSALGVHKDAALSLPIPASRQHICYGLDHFDLLSSGDVYDRIYRWLDK
jgi:pimeloyl-ACP methyl ester carboxylesterase